MNLDVTLTQLETAQLVRRISEEEAMYMFKHALVQDAAYSTLLKQHRKRLHRAVGETLERAYPDRLDEFAARLAQHFAEAGDDAKTLEYSIRAGEASERLYAFTEARFHYESALTALAHMPETIETRRAQVDVTIKYTTVAYTSDEPPRMLARLVKAESLLTQLLQANDAADRLRLARLHLELGRAYIILNEPAKGFGYYQQLLEESKELGDDALYATTAGQIGTVMAIHGQFAQAIPLLTPATLFLEKMQSWREWVHYVAHLAWSLAEHGQLAEAFAMAERFLTKANEIQNYAAISTAHAFMARLYEATGDAPRMLEAARASAEIAEQGGEVVSVLIVMGFLALAQSRVGDHAAAAATMARQDALSASVGAPPVLADWIAASRAEIALNARRIDEALALAQKAVSIAQAVEGQFAEGLAHRTWAQALLDSNPLELAEPESHLATSLRLFEKGDARLEAARTHFAWGKLSIERNDRESAKTHLEQAATQFELSGLTRELNEARVLLSVEQS